MDKFFKSVIIFFVIFFGVAILSDIGFKLDDRVESKAVEKLQSENDQLKLDNKMLNDYINWKDCMVSDSIDCQTCDSLYNVNGDFVY